MNPLLLLLIAANGLISYRAFNDPSFFRKYEFHIGRIRAGDHIRMISSAFLHADWGHLFFNMFTLYMFAPVVLGYLDSITFLLLYLGSLVFGSLLTLMLHKDDYSYCAVGASGAVTGVVYSAILLEPQMRLFLFFIPIPISAYLFGIVYLLYSIYGMKAKNDHIGHTAHFGGAVGGFLITLVKMPELWVQEPLMIGLLLLPIIILFYLAKSGKI